MKKLEFREIKGSELIDTVVIDTVTPWWTAHMAKEALSRYAPRPWGMQPNTSPAADLPRSPWAFHCSCLPAAYYTTLPFCMFYKFYTAKTFSCILCISWLTFSASSASLRLCVKNLTKSRQARRSRRRPGTGASCRTASPSPVREPSLAAMHTAGAPSAPRSVRGRVRPFRTRPRASPCR